MIPPKGRPISQCQHCRSLRRSKSAHVKCDCGEKTAKCPHLKPTVEGHQSTCCCHHGAPCTCCHKKPQHRSTAIPDADAAKDVTSKPVKPARRRRSKNSIHLSDATLTFDEHGHHKPTYKHTKASQKSGPYQLHRTHSSQSSSTTSTHSLESLGMDNFGCAFSVDGNHGFTQTQDQRIAKSESASPLPDDLSTVTMAGMPASLAPIQTNIQSLWNSPWGSSAITPDPLFSGAEEQDPIVSAGISPSADFSLYNWSGFDASGYNFDGLPALTSGEGSENEADDFISPGVGITPFGSLSRTNTSSSIFTLDQHTGFSTGDVVDMLASNEAGKFYESAVTASLESTDAILNAAPPHSEMLDEQFTQWMEMNSDPQSLISMWDTAS